MLQLFMRFRSLVCVIVTIKGIHFLLALLRCIHIEQNSTLKWHDGHLRCNLEPGDMHEDSVYL